MSENNTVMKQLIEARESLKRLPILGPAVWLYARDDHKKYTFIAEQDWLLIPPIILDQCKLFTRDEIPWAFATWAFVSDEINTRLRADIPRIAPHEWKSGSHPWLMDLVAPFGERETMLQDLHRTVFNGAGFSAIEVLGNGTVRIQDYPALSAQAH